ncbi:MAG: hypothetical protein AMXMBFR58_11540 [Phycisphaerae bacterium]|nr:hypothetical protein [Phycisphaerales bacterium]MCK6477204.1 hypothetical protein [Phycisphaerales bacterium]
MRTNVFVGAAAVILSSVGAGAATYNDHGAYMAATVNNTVINFDTDPAGNAISSGTFLGSIYSSMGVEFAPGGFVASGVGPVSTPNIWIDDTNFPTPLFVATITAPNITAVGVFNALFSGGDYERLTAFDADNNELGFVDADTDSGNKDFFGLTTNAPIARIEIEFRNQNGWGLDDLHLGQVPAPGLAGLAAIAGLVSAGRRRR